MSNHSEILPAAPLLSGLPDARPASAMGGIDPGALPELVLRSAPAPLEPFANPEGARQVSVDGPETTGPNWVFFSNFQVFHTLESETVSETVLDETPRDETPWTPPMAVKATSRSPSPAWAPPPQGIVVIRIWNANGSLEATFGTSHC